MSLDVKYRTEAQASGGGRDGITKLASGMLTLTMNSPKELGGSGKGHNPEELFAMGYAACFLSAMRFVAQAEKLGTVPESATVDAQVAIGGLPEGGFGLAVKLVAKMPGLERDTAEAILARAHELCPYSNATRGNIDVTLELA
ncbi:organic hydroperoxide resistance protein [Alloyangia pacifica]|uniref:Peroxiredoxin, Ohr subfamily n=1 Tax=Alloyangia pacifica TaxID=311180 RepID=A0A1I6WC77_9RHOB|nr:organic hydroperoxide resistance protein [Alloyangia pacifica]SDI49643.1 peroxiredoxin, Ohr subfamily [Alloyangia pacifica]SFT23164.1 peroxiredoxin, Ohr subfamily [Alloyangia pacifica]